MNKNFFFFLFVLHLMCACNENRYAAMETSEDSTNVEYSDAEGEDNESATLKIGPEYDTWVQTQYANADYDYKSITNGEKFAINDGVTLIDDMINNIHTLEGRERNA